MTMRQTGDVDLSIVMVNWHSADYVLGCIDSIRDQTKAVRYEIIVVDNASFDECRERLARECPDVVFVQNARNEGFAAGNNVGVAHAQGKVLLFLNPDTKVLNGAIDRLYECLCATEDVGVLGARLLNEDGTIQTTSILALPTVVNQVFGVEILQRWFPQAQMWKTQALYERGRRPVEVEAVSGACMMTRRRVFDAVGGFDTEYFMYGEDVDLCFRTRQAGFRNYHFGPAVIVHYGGGSSRKAPSTFSVMTLRKAVRLFLRKRRGRAHATLYRVAMTGAALGRLGMLTAGFPVAMSSRGRVAWRRATRKWLIIAGWGMGLEGCLSRLRARSASGAGAPEVVDDGA